MAELIARYLEERLPYRGEDKETVGPQLIWWKAQLGPYFLSDITPQRIAEYRDKLLREPMVKGRVLKNATVVRYLASLSVCMRYGMEDLGWLESNPVQDVRKPTPERGRVRALTQDEHVRLLAACEASPNPYILTIVILALSTGARMSEILNPDLDQRGF